MSKTLLDEAWKRQDALDAVLSEGTAALERLRKAGPMIDSRTAMQLGTTLRLCGANLQSVANSLERPSTKRRFQ